MLLDSVLSLTAYSQCQLSVLVDGLYVCNAIKQPNSALRTPHVRPGCLRLVYYKSGRVLYHEVSKCDIHFEMHNIFLLLNHVLACTHSSSFPKAGHFDLLHVCKVRKTSAEGIYGD